MVTIEEMKQAINAMRNVKFSHLFDKLNEHQKIIYAILLQKRRMSSGPLYHEYCRRVKKPVVKRAYRNYMDRMVKLGLVRALGSGRWRRYEIVSN